ncbi:hypothetical protein H0H92_008355, partial [Tricholoma furcatifolium]
YIAEVHTEGNAKEIVADIDRRIAAAPSFPGLRRFPQGRGFKQWTGNDSKGLMKVYLPAIQGHVPPDMVRAVAALIEFCYLVRRDVIDEDALEKIREALRQFHQYREAFREVRPEGFSLPRQHSLTHYVDSITQFGSPNGLCSSITESKHIQAVKRPYRRSNKNQPLGQMLITNQRLNKLAAARIDFLRRGMLNGSGLPPQLNFWDDDEDHDPLPFPITGRHEPPPPPPLLEPLRDSEDAGAVEGTLPKSMSEITLARCYVRKVPRDLFQLAHFIKQPDLIHLTRRFLYNKLYPNAEIPSTQVMEDNLPCIQSKIYMYNSARAVFYAPSNISGLGGLYQERIRATSSWFGAPRYDCVFIGNSDSDADGMEGLLVARVLLFFSFKDAGIQYPCALVHWFSHSSDAPCDETGMWIVEPDFYRDGRPVLEPEPLQETQPAQPGHSSPESTLSQPRKSLHVGSPRVSRSSLKRGRENIECVAKILLLHSELDFALRNLPPAGTPAKLVRTVGLPIINNAAPPRVVPEFWESCEAIAAHLEHLKERYDIQKAFKDTFQADLDQVNKDLRAARTENMRLQRQMRERVVTLESEMESLKKQFEDSHKENVRLRELLTSTGNRLITEGYQGVDEKPNLKEEAKEEAVSEPKLEA